MNLKKNPSNNSDSSRKFYETFTLDQPVILGQMPPLPAGNINSQMIKLPNLPDFVTSQMDLYERDNTTQTNLYYPIDQNSGLTTMKLGSVAKLGDANGVPTGKPASLRRRVSRSECREGLRFGRFFVFGNTGGRGDDRGDRVELGRLGNDHPRYPLRTVRPHRELAVASGDLRAGDGALRLEDGAARQHPRLPHPSGAARCRAGPASPCSG